MRPRLKDRWLTPPWEWGLRGGGTILILVFAIVLLIERDRLVSFQIEIGGEGRFTIGAVFEPDEAIGVPLPGSEVEISAMITGFDAITQPSTCSLEVLFPDQPPIRVDPVAVSEEGAVSWLLPSDDFASVVGATPVTAEVTADCDVSDKEFEVPAELDFVADIGQGP